MTVLDDEPMENAAVAKKPKTDAILDAIMARIAPAEVSIPTLKVLIYGEPGVGKTVFSATAPKPLLIDVERGSRSVLNVNNPVDVLEYRSIEQVEAVVQYLKNGNSTFDKYDTIILDSITELQARLLDQQLRELGDSAPVYKADFGVWGVNTQRLRMLVSAFRDIEKNLICTAHVRTEKDEITSLNVIKPFITPGLSKTVSGIFDVVGYLRIDSKGQRILRLKPTKTILAKTRLALPDEVMNPTWTNISI